MWNAFGLTYVMWHKYYLSASLKQIDMLKIEMLKSGTWFLNAHKVPVEIQILPLNNQCWHE